jgi:hypothetical protein
MWRPSRSCAPPTPSSLVRRSRKPRAETLASFFLCATRSQGSSFAWPTPLIDTPPTTTTSCCPSSRPFRAKPYEPNTTLSCDGGVDGIAARTDTWESPDAAGGSRRSALLSAVVAAGAAATFASQAALASVFDEQAAIRVFEQAARSVRVLWLPAWRVPYSDERVRIATCGISGGDELTRPFRHARRFPFPGL